MAVSIIVPIYNEAKQMIDRLISNISLQKGEFELIFVDASKIPFKSNKYKVISSQKGRGIQLNLGAKEAKFENLLFLHADSTFKNNNAILDVFKALKTHKIGCFKLEFKPNSIPLSLIAIGSNLRIRFRNIAFGDQGIFIKKELFNKLGGFSNIPIMEDYEFSMRVKNAQEKYYVLNNKIITSSRKFNKEGIIKTLIKMQILQAKFRNGVSANELAKIY